MLAAKNHSQQQGLIIALKAVWLLNQHLSKVLYEQTREVRILVFHSVSTLE